jgi:hypothetical protein
MSVRRFRRIQRLSIFPEIWKLSLFVRRDVRPFSDEPSSAYKSCLVAALPLFLSPFPHRPELTGSLVLLIC